MTLDEVRKRIAKSPDSEWLNSLEVNLDFKHLDFTINLKGISSIYQFVSTQSSGWSKIQEDLPRELKISKDLFDTSKNQIINLISGVGIANKSYDWTNIKNPLETQSKKYFTYESPELEFLIKIYNEFRESFMGAYKYIVNDTGWNVNEKKNFIGTALAYEFTLKNNSKILERRNAEKASIGKIRNDFLNYLTESETQISEYIKKTDEAFTIYSGRIDELKSSKEKLFEEWFILSKDTFTQFDVDSKKKISDLEKAYEGLLSLKKPADYWNKRAAVLKKEGQVFLRWLVGLVLFGCVTLYLLLWLTPEGMLLSFIKGQASAIKWSIIYITFISLLAFGIKAISKVMFSSFHLARDAEEREQLTYVYLAMIKEGAADEKDKSLIMQSLFSRSDTGLLKEDSGPTMPSNTIAEKFIQR